MLFVCRWLLFMLICCRLDCFQVSRQSCPLNRPATRAWWEFSRLRTNRWSALRPEWPISFRAWWCSIPQCLRIRYQSAAFRASLDVLGFFSDFDEVTCVFVRCLCSRVLRAFLRQPISNRSCCRDRPIRRQHPPPACRCITAWCHRRNTLASGNTCIQLSTNQI